MKQSDDRNYGQLGESFGEGRLARSSRVKKAQLIEIKCLQEVANLLVRQLQKGLIKLLKMKIFISRHDTV